VTIVHLGKTIKVNIKQALKKGKRTSKANIFKIWRI